MKKYIITVIYPGEFKMTYIRSYTPDVPVNQILEFVFDEWNSCSAHECVEFIASKVRSLSVNDIVAVNTQHFQCEGCGWKKVTLDYVDNLEALIQDHPDLKLHGPWWALQDTHRLGLTANC